MIGCFTGVMSVSMLFHVVSWSFHDCFHVGFMLVSTSPHLISRLVAWMFPWLLHPFSTINSLGAFFVSRRWFLRHLRLRSCLEWCCHGWGTHRENLGRTWRIFTWLGGLGVRESFSKCSKQFRFRNYRRICPNRSHPLGKRCKFWRAYLSHGWLNHHLDDLMTNEQQLAANSWNINILLGGWMTSIFFCDLNDSKIPSFTSEQKNEFERVAFENTSEV